MATKLIASSPGEGVEELTISNWLKKVGDKVEEMEPVVEVETDKVVTEIPSPVAGTLIRIDVPAGNTVKVGESMGMIGEPGEISENTQPAPEVSKASENTPEPTVNKSVPTSEHQLPKEPPSASTESVGFISPLVRKMAEENNLDLSKIKGTGEGGRITKADVNAYLENKPVPVEKTAPRSTPQVITAPQKSTEAAPTVEGTLIPHSANRRIIAERMLRSVQTSPHVLTVMEADMSRVLAHRKINKPLFANDGINLTLTAYFMAAIVEGLKSNPLLNAQWTEEGVYEFKNINIGMAVAMGAAGLIVPVIHDAQNLSLQGLAKSVNDLTDRARGKKLLPEDVRGATFTLTNHGTGGSLFASPIINQPQLAILGTGMMQKRVIVITDSDGNDTIAIRPMVYLSLVFDHRVIDGESGDAFLMKVKQVLENWA